MGAVFQGSSYVLDPWGKWLLVQPSWIMNVRSINPMCNGKSPAMWGRVRVVYSYGSTFHCRNERTGSNWWHCEHKVCDCWCRGCCILGSFCMAMGLLFLIVWKRPVPFISQKSASLCLGLVSFWPQLGSRQGGRMINFHNRSLTNKPWEPLPKTKWHSSPWRPATQYGTMCICVWKNDT